VSDQLNYDELSRINSFAHVNHSVSQISIGILLCINGAGIFNRWIKNVAGANISYDSLNAAAASVEPGSNGLMALPFGNGAERMLENKIVGAQFYDLDLNVHTTAHMVRAGQEGIAFAFRYGLDIMRENGIVPSVIRAGRSNLFLSDVFTGSFVNANNVSVEFYEGDGSFGAAMGAGIGAGIYEDAGSALQHRKPVKTVEPTMAARYDELYEKWKDMLNTRMESIGKNEKLSLA
jgi:xylulokinase